METNSERAKAKISTDCKAVLMCGIGSCM